jgi:hypothetical protein
MATGAGGNNDDEYQQALPLSVQERDGHVTIYCTAKDCFWSWRLYNGSTEANGRTIDSAVKHALERHVQRQTDGR